MSNFKTPLLTHTSFIFKGYSLNKYIFFLKGIALGKIYKNMIFIHKNMISIKVRDLELKACHNLCKHLPVPYRGSSETTVIVCDTTVKLKK